ncbi:hypothetical protein EZY14_007005 [Kordia sp. TARA_039_SRF]|nr:hypothetical protein EZY14_007005 [Kordia sp. TARA_039_SRF]
MKKNILIKFKVIILTICISIGFISCSEQSEFSDNEYAFKKVAVAFLENAKETTINKQMINSNYSTLLKSFQNVSNKSNVENETYTFEELSIMFEINFGIPSENTMRFFNIAYENRDLLLKENARELFTEQLKLELDYIIGQDATNEKWLFATLYEMIAGDDTHCALGVLAHIVDAMILTATAAITAPTGIGAATAGTGVASSVAAATHAASNCD